jgi:Putative Flp pilus-assembly TadE/G-like
MRKFLRRRRFNSEHNREQGVIITLVAVFMLFVLGAMAALSIDVVTFYTARSEAQLAADGAALAGARVLANSGMTSDINGSSDGVPSRAEAFAQAVAMQVAKSNPVGGRTLQDSEITIGFAGGQNSACGTSSSFSNPCITVRVQRNDLPTFFAHIWGSTQITVAAVATAEAYNSSGLAGGISAVPAVPVATSCVKPWLLPNIDPTGTAPIFSPTTGAIQNSALWGWGADGSGIPMYAAATLAPTVWQYRPVQTGNGVGQFPVPPANSVDCSQSAGFTGTDYELTIAGCETTPISCNQLVSIDTSQYALRDYETAVAVNCLNHSSAGLGDKFDPTTYAAGPFEFLTGADNPLVQAGAIGFNKDVFVSDSLVTVPVFDCGSCTVAPSPVQVIGFVQLFLSPLGTATPTVGTPGLVSTAIVNMVGCGTASSGTPLVGNGASAVPVRLISPPGGP